MDLPQICLLVSSLLLLYLLVVDAPQAAALKQPEKKVVDVPVVKPLDPAPIDSAPIDDVQYATISAVNTPLVAPPLTSAPTPVPTPSSTYVYRGCYADGGVRAVGVHDSGYIPHDTCRNLAVAGNHKYFAVQDAKNLQSANPVGQCFLGNAGDDYDKYGVATNCSNVEGRDYGSAWSNAVYEQL
jgi:hypothetical protein